MVIVMVFVRGDLLMIIESVLIIFRLILDILWLYLVDIGHCLDIGFLGKGKRIS